MEKGKSNEHDALLWPLKSRPGNFASTVYALQWFGVSIVQIGVVALIIGPYLGLNQGEIAVLSQRLFFFAGIITLLQVTLGHKLPIVEGPASQWWVTFICLINVGLSMGKSITAIRTELMGAMCISALFLLIIGAGGILGKLKRYFTPAFVGSALILLTLQISKTFVTGILGITETHPQVDITAFTASVISIAVVMGISYSRFSFLRSINLLLGLFAGWGADLLLTRQLPGGEAVTPLGFQVPRFFLWGAPTFNAGMVTTGLMLTVMLLSSNIASTTAMSRVTGIPIDERRLNRSVICNGVGNLLAGLGSSVGDVPLTASVGMVKLSGVAARKPVVIFGAIMVAIGFFPGVGILFTLIPRPVGYAVMMASYTQVFIAGLKNIKEMQLGHKDSFVLGFAIIIGVGLTSLPLGAMEGMPLVIRYVAGQGMFTGLLICFLLERLLK